MSDLNLQLNGSCCELRRHFLHMYDNSSQFDVALLCDDTRIIKTHRAMLSAYCKYFRDLFEMELFNKLSPTVISPTPVVIVMKDYDYTVLKRIFDLLYRGDCCVPHDQVNDMLKYAGKLGIGVVFDCFVKLTTGDLNSAKNISQTLSPDAQFCSTDSQQFSSSQGPPPSKDLSQGPPPSQDLSQLLLPFSYIEPHETQLPQVLVESESNNASGVFTDAALRSDNSTAEKKNESKNELRIPDEQDSVQLISSCEDISNYEWNPFFMADDPRYNDFRSSYPGEHFPRGHFRRPEFAHARRYKASYRYETEYEPPRPNVRNQNNQRARKGKKVHNNPNNNNSNNNNNNNKNQAKNKKNCEQNKPVNTRIKFR